MNRSNLAILVFCALLTTTIEYRDDGELISWPLIESIEGPLSAIVEGRPNTNVAPLVKALRPDPIDPSEERIFSQILDRLEMRHTALPDRERRALARTIMREARANELDPALVVAVIEVESAGYHLAVSRVGAMGLMQLLPSTGRELAEKMAIEWKGDDTLFDPVINVRLGTAYLRQLANRYASVDTALAAYNWGPGRIDRRLRRGAAVPSRYIRQVLQAADRNALSLVSRS